MMSPKPSLDVGDSRSNGHAWITNQRPGSASFRYTPLQIIHIIGNFMRIWSVFSMYLYVTEQGASVIAFLFTCLVPSSIIFLALQKPWKGRALSNSQVVPSIINGGITALYFIFWGKGLKSCGPVRAIMAEYAGAVLGVLSAFLYGRWGRLWKKVGGLLAIMAAFYLLSQGWATTTYSPFPSKGSLGTDSSTQTDQPLEIKTMTVPIIAGILSALRRVIARRVSLKNQLKRRLHAITITSATCFLFPLAMWEMLLGPTAERGIKPSFPTWAYLSMTLFGIIFVYYVDNIAEERTTELVLRIPGHFWTICY
ncbi:uncharacterized protein LOC18432140 isoform X2 [Amborella trichopoda]|uniref:uncharacterized protein LOC18432140 isoform X2 n=1 Tax=Amborella trichopoda TaxID=13333 RepID=UPI0009BDFB7B|nr:uncharacterized protein LOC18432140 isoform X2 [Amborella trichopoda]|eukprot:XP_020521619.1 uncharacterized protein LOC18432140 isoform X2 [Amborella trichopoda]